MYDSMRKWFSRIGIVLMILSIICVPKVTAPVQAAQSTGSITFTMEGYEDIEFSIYKVAVQDGADGYERVGDFADMPEIDLFSKTAAQTLKEYVAAEQVEPLDTRTTDEDGQIVFEDMSLGAYLILGKDFTQALGEGEIKYTMNPVLISIPTTDEETEELIYDVTATAKYKRTILEGDTTDFTVVKKWNDKKAPSGTRPTSITVELGNEDGVYDTVTLTSDNDWSYTWSDLDKSKEWYVVEKNTPANYKVAITSGDDGANRTITNTYEPPTTTTAETTAPSTTTVPPTTTTPQTTTAESPKKLPQTGQLWWPVAVLGVSGGTLLLLGVLLKRTKRR